MEILIRRPLKSRRAKLVYQMKRRDRARDLKLCINNEAHGQATDGCRCAGCATTHRRSA